MRLRFLKWLMIFMIALVVLALLLVGYFYATAKVSVVSSTSQGVAADTQGDQFAQIKTDVARGAFIGTLLRTEPLGDAANYAFITYTLRVSNQCLVPIDMIELQVVPASADVLQIGNLSVRALNAKTVGDVSATILTARNTNPVREVIVTYYVWGVSFSLRLTCGG